MKLVSYTHAGRESYGLFDGQQVLQPPADFLARHANLAAVLKAGAMAELQLAATTRGTALAAASLQWLPVLPRPAKVICVGLNYRDHVAETQRDDSAYPALFVRFTDTLAGHGAGVPKPSFSDMLDWEGELAVVIGKGGRSITQADALQHVAGYACFNDVSVRDWQRHTHQWTPGKNFPGSGPLGPWLVTRDEVPDLNALTLTTRVNGQVMQQASVADLIFTVPVLIEYISRFTPLSPGDVIATGTPGGVGSRRKPPIWLKVGDVVEVDITGLGVLSNTIVAGD
jgi:2-keto-4-pentenoate hydratase/2-oxohepta-3-ene-1,7-dioic acid hydratase in catechol pathway